MYNDMYICVMNIHIYIYICIHIQLYAIQHTYRFKHVVCDSKLAEHIKVVTYVWLQSMCSDLRMGRLHDSP